MDGSAAQAVICIGDNRSWLTAVAERSSQTGGPAPTVLSWHQFDSAPFEYAHPHCLAYARIDDEEGELDVRLGKLCRSFPYGVLLELAPEISAPDRQFFAHGLQIIGGAGKKIAPTEGEKNLLNPAERCFQFRLEDYKNVPDWLNARFWAHPERFHL